jgi:hypothetical protein
MWLLILTYIWLILPAFPDRMAEAHPDAVHLPVEVLGEDGTTVDTSLQLSLEQKQSVRSLWLQVHGVRYPDQASVQVNRSAWIPLRNDTVIVTGLGKSFGGIGGGFATLELSVPLRADMVVTGTNKVRFRFNRSDGLSSGFRVLAMNFLAGDGSKILPSTNFEEDAPESWTPPLAGTESIRAGKELWLNAPLVASSLPHSPRIQARCADCHANDGRDLKYFNFSNKSIVARSRFHGLSTQQGEQIASYIRSLPFLHPGRPWNPPYQPGPGMDARPVSEWAAGAGLAWVLDSDSKTLPYLLDVRLQQSDWTQGRSSKGRDLRVLPGQIHPDGFRPDGDLNPREIPIALQLPDWSQWLPRIHPKDAWGIEFFHSEFAMMYNRGPGREKGIWSKTSLRTLLAGGQASEENARSIVPAFSRWSQARRSFLGHYVNGKTAWTPDLTNKVYSAQLWQLVKTWEMTEEYELEGRGHRLLGHPSESRMWCNTILAETAPAAAHIPNGTSGVGGSALTNEYLSASWYELQILLNSGNHQHRDRSPLDWVYLIGQFHDLYALSHQPEPVRLLVAVTKALQSTDPHFGPSDFRQGWRPDQEIDPRIMISPKWGPIFTPLSSDVRRALTEALLAAWMDKNLQYPITEYLPLPTLQRTYKPRESYSDISGGKVWNAAGDFRAAGVSEDVVERLRNWGIAYTDRAERIQYH